VEDVPDLLFQVPPELTDAGVEEEPTPVPAAPELPVVAEEAPAAPLIELGAVEAAPLEDLEDEGSRDVLPPGPATVSLSFSAPRIADRDIQQKVDVCNSVLTEVAGIIDDYNGPGTGQAAIQLLLDGAPTAFSLLFHGIEVSHKGELSFEPFLDNLRRRPPAEHRRLLSRGLMDLIERGLSSSCEELTEDAIETLLERVVGYQQRMRS
jgi:hypothetical protein